MLCCMNGLNLNSNLINELRRAHRLAKDKHDADRIKSIYLLAQGMSAQEIARVLMIDEDTVRNNWKRYEEGGIEGLLKNNYKGSESMLSTAELVELEKHLEEKTYLTIESIVSYVEQQYEVNYSISGMTQLLQRIGFVYKKAKAVPGKADKEQQLAYLKLLTKILKNKGKNDPHYYLDAVHPQHNTQVVYGWIKKGKEKLINSNTGRQRININGALNSESLEIVIREDETINTQSTLALFKTLEKKYRLAQTIYITLDNAKYYKNPMVREYLKSSKIRLLFLPPYSPNLNLIERLWKFMRQEVLYNQYYEKFSEFKEVIMEFFDNIRQHKKKLSTLLTNNFQLLNSV